MNAEIYIPKKSISKPVKNLGWLLKHKHKVVEFTFYYHKHGLYDGWLIAPLNDGPPGNRTVFKCFWASFSICQEWLRKCRCWKGLELKVVYISENDEIKSVNYTI